MQQSACLETGSSYTATTRACYLGCLVQGITMNFSPLLFIPLREQFGLSYTMLGSLVMANFLAQVLADLVFGRPVDKYGFRPFLLSAFVACILGLVLFGTMPVLFPGSAYPWLVVGTVIFSLGIGLLEVLLSPVINAIPSDCASASMARLHAFYAWGMFLAVAISALSLYALGNARWYYVALFWAVLPFVALLLFIKVPLPDKIHESQRIRLGTLLSSRVFIFGLLTIFFGAAAEMTMASWLSSFLEKGLGMTKVSGDLLGLGGFAFFLGLTRMVYGFLGNRLEVNRVIIGGSAVAVVCYLAIALTNDTGLSILACCVAGIATAMIWPGTLSATSAKMPAAGVIVFALLAAGGDAGTSVFSWCTGAMTDFFAAHAPPSLSLAAEQYGLKMGMLISVVYPLLSLVFASCLLRTTGLNKKEETG